MSVQKQVFSVQTADCGEVILTQDRWDHATLHHPEIAPYVEYVRQTLESPWCVYDTPYNKPTYVYYKRELILDDPRYRDCYVAVLVRYTMTPSQAWTAYLPAHILTNVGNLIRLER